MSSSFFSAPNAWNKHQSIQIATQALQQGQVIGYPTEAVWGVGCDPYNEAAFQSLLRLKQRPLEKGVIVVAANWEQAEPLLSELSAEQQQLLKNSWPGPNTWVVPNNGRLPEWISGKHASIAIRVSAHPIVKALCENFGGILVSTSANPSGMAAAKTRVMVKKYFGESIYLAPGQTGKESKPSTIRDAITGKRLR